MADRIEHKIWYVLEDKNGHPFYDFNFRDVPTDLIEHVVHGLTYELLARSGVHYDQSDLEKRFGIKIDYFKAIEQAINAKKTLIDVEFVDERQKNWNTYQEHCRVTGNDPKQIFIDFPISKI